MIWSHRDDVKNNANISGNLETVSPIDELLDDLILEKDEIDTEKRNSKNESSERDKKLINAGK